MLILLGANAETIIGIVAVIVIVISAGIIVATAVRNYLLYKKSVKNGDVDSFAENEVESIVQEISSNQVETEVIDRNGEAIVTEQEGEAANTADDVKNAFSAEGEEIQETQEIEFELQQTPIAENENKLVVDDIADSAIKDKQD